MSRTFLAKWRNAVRDSELLDSSAKLTALTLSTYMDKDGLAWPAKTTLATKAGLGARTIDRAIAKLETFNFLLVDHATGYRRGGNTYRAVIPNSVMVADSNASLATANSVNGDRQYRHGGARKHLESNRKRPTTAAVTAEVGKSQNCGVANNPTEAALRWFDATGRQMQEEDAKDMLFHHFGLSEIEAKRILRTSEALA
jgi:Helix-turn-helix domain